MKRCTRLVILLLADRLADAVTPHQPRVRCRAEASRRRSVPSRRVAETYRPDARLRAALARPRATNASCALRDSTLRVSASRTKPESVSPSRNNDSASRRSLAETRRGGMVRDFMAFAILASQLRCMIRHAAPSVTAREAVVRADKGVV